MSQRIIITPEATIISLDGVTEQYEILPDSISVVLEDGQMFNITEITALLAKKCKPAKKPGRIAKFKQAFTKAMEELDNESDDIRSVG